MAEIRSNEEARRVAMILRDREDLPEDVRERMMASLRLYDQTNDPEPAPEPETPGDRATGLLDKAGNFVSGIVDFTGAALVGAGADVAGGLAGLGSLAFGGDADDAAASVDETRETVVKMFGSAGQIDNPATKELLAKAAPVLQEIEEGIDTIAMGPDGDGSPMAGAMIKTAILGFPEILGLKTGALRAGARAEARAAVRETAEKAGIRLDPASVTDDFVEAAKRQVVATKGEGVDDVVRALQSKREAASARVEAKFDAAKQSRQAFLNADNADAFTRALRERLIKEGYDLDGPGMTQVRRTVDDLANLRRKKPGQGRRPTEFIDDATGELVTSRRAQAVDFDLNDWELIRRRINKRFGSDGQANTALNSIKKDMDNWLDQQFNADMIRGDATAVARWQAARQAHIAYRNNWRADRTIRNLTDVDASPEEWARWIQGANAANANPQMVGTVERLGELLGKESAEFRAVKMNVLHDLVEPIFKASPGQADYRRVVQNIDNFTRRKASAVKALGLDSGDLMFMRNVAKALDTIKPSKAIVGSVPRAVMRFMFGHGIARAGLKVMLAGNVADKIFKTNMATRKSIMNEIAGLPDLQTLIPRGSTTAAAVFAQEFENQVKDDR